MERENERLRKEVAFLKNAVLELNPEFVFPDPSFFEASQAAEPAIQAPSKSAAAPTKPAAAPTGSPVKKKKRRKRGNKKGKQKNTVAPPAAVLKEPESVAERDQRLALDELGREAKRIEDEVLNSSDYDDGDDSENFDVNTCAAVLQDKRFQDGTKPGGSIRRQSTFGRGEGKMVKKREPSGLQDIGLLENRLKESMNKRQSLANTSNTSNNSNSKDTNAWQNIDVEKRLSKKQLNALKEQFSAIDKDSNSRLSFEEFSKALGLLEVSAHASLLAKFLFRSIDFDGDGSVSLDEFLVALTVMVHGTPDEKLALSFEMVDLDGDGFVTEGELLIVVQSMAAVLCSMHVKTAIDPFELVKKMMDTLDTDKDGRISFEEYQAMSKDSELATLVSHFSDGVGVGDSTSKDHFASSLRDSKFGGSKSGVNVSFGSYHFNMVLSMMLGMQLTAQLVDAPQNRDLNDLTTEDYIQTESFRLPYNKKLMGSEKYDFTEYAPNVLQSIRNYCGISEDSYFAALGPSQVLGNLLMGNLSSMRMSVSQGKSGSFFFQSYDARFFIKTISKDEKYAFHRMLPAYVKYIRENPKTMITRIYGFYAINGVPFIVMGNVFNVFLSLDTIYDLKGSTLGRTNKDKKGVLKDLDFEANLEMLKLKKSESFSFLEQMRRDSKFLAAVNIIDYSLIVGIHRGSSNSSASAEPISADFRAYLEANQDVRMLEGENGDLYFVGIIDCLTEYNFKKATESLLKSIAHKRKTVSAIPPKPYGLRFRKYITKITEFIN